MLESGLRTADLGEVVDQKIGTREMAAAIASAVASAASQPTQP
jgi:hypothetical protein